MSFMTSDVNAFTSDGLIGQSNSFGNDWLQLLQRRANIVINVLGTVDMLQKFSVCAWYTRCRQRHETVDFFMHHPVITMPRPDNLTLGRQHRFLSLWRGLTRGSRCERRQRNSTRVPMQWLSRTGPYCPVCLHSDAGGIHLYCRHSSHLASTTLFICLRPELNLSDTNFTQHENSFVDKNFRKQKML